MNKIIAIMSGVVIIGGGSFYAGMKYDQSKTASDRQARLQQFGTGGPGGAGRNGGRANGGFAAGEVLARDDKSITIKMRDGGSKIIFLTGSTPVTKSVSGSVQDISVGSQVTVMGTANQDGSLSAESIQIRPNTTGAIKEFTVTGSNYSFSPSTITVKKGDHVKIAFVNSGGVHDFRLDEFNVATKRIQEGEQDVIEFTADKTGSFEYYCSVGSHRAMGMKGTLTVAE